MPRNTTEKGQFLSLLFLSLSLHETASVRVPRRHRVKMVPEMRPLPPDRSENSGAVCTVFLRTFFPWAEHPATHRGGDRCADSGADCASGLSDAARMSVLSWILPHRSSTCSFRSLHKNMSAEWVGGHVFRKGAWNTTWIFLVLGAWKRSGKSKVSNLPHESSVISHF